jgi:transcriptional regulator with XRE-family HTH domain
MTTDNNTAKLGAYLREARTCAGLSIRELARLAGINHSYLVKLETDQKDNPSADVLQRLAEALELDPTEVLGFIGIAPSNLLPPARVYFRKKYGLSEADARRAAALIEQYTRKGTGNEQVTKGGHT